MHFAILCVFLLSLSLSAFHHVECRPSILLPGGEKKVQTHLMIMFLSHAGDNMRNSLRETWLRDNVNETRHVFVLGNIDASPHKEDILKEQKQYEDMIILDDVIDDYEHLSDKTLKGFKAVHSLYTFDFLLKTDTDTFIVLPKLLEYLENFKPHAMYIGNFAFTQDPNEVFGHLKGVYYMLGGGYIMSYDLVEYFAHSQHLMRRTRSEDVTVGIHLHSLELTMDHVNDTLFKAGAASGCSCMSTLILNHKCMAHEMYFMYYSYKESGEICQYRKSVPIAEGMAIKYKIPNPFPNTNELSQVSLRWK